MFNFVMAVTIAVSIFALGFQLFFELQLRNEIWGYVIATEYNHFWGAFSMLAGIIFLSMLIAERVKKKRKGGSKGNAEGAGTDDHSGHS